MSTSYQAVVPIPNGYFLEKDEGFLTAIIPERRTNYVLNPLLENDITSITNTLKNITLTSATFLRIAGGPFWLDYLRFTLNVNSVIANKLPGTNISGTVSASVWVKSLNNNVTFRIRVRAKDSVTTNDVTFTSEIFTVPTKDFEQFTFTFTPTNGIYNGTLDILIVTGTTIDVAGMQLERGKYATTFIHGYAGEGYSWNGQPTNATSLRTEDVICGGREINLRELGFRITSVEGLGIPDNFDINMQAKASGMGSTFTCRSIGEREVTVTGIVYAKDLKALLTQRNSLGYAVFDKAAIRCFKWQPATCDNTFECVHFTGILESGMSFGYNTHHGEEIELTFVDPNVKLESCTTTCETLNTIPTDTTARLFAFDENGNRHLLPVPTLSGYTQELMLDLTYSTYTKKLYVAMSAIPSGGMGATQYLIMEYDGSEWIPIVFSTRIVSKVFAHGNFLFAGAAGAATFTGQNGWTGTSVGPLFCGNLTSKTIISGVGDIQTTNVLAASGASVAPNVAAFASDGGDYIFFGGNFSSNSSFESDLGMLNIRASSSANPQREFHGISGYATTRGGIKALLYIQEKRELWLGGDFNNNILSGTANQAQGFFGYSFARATQVNKFGSGIYQYPQLAATSGVSPLGVVHALAYYKGRVILGGQFSDIESASTLVTGYTRVNGLAYIDEGGIARPFNGSWGVNVTGAALPTVIEMSVCDDVLHIAGIFKEYGVVDKQFGTFTRQGTALGAVDFVAAGYAESGSMTQAIISSVIMSGEGKLNGVVCTDNPDYALVYFAEHNTNVTSATYLPQTVTLCSNRLETSPIVYMRGPGTVRGLKNYANGTRIDFNYKFATFGLVGGALASDEVLMFDFTQNPIKVTSSIFGDVSSRILPTSIPLILSPGTNEIAIDFEPDSTTVNTKAWLCWRETALSAEALQTECL